VTGVRWWAALLVTLLVTAACAGGDREPESTTTTAGDAGVAFPDPVTVPPTDASTSSTTVDPQVTLSPGAPRGFPADFPRPDDAEVLVGSATMVGEDRVLSIDLTTTDTVDDVTGFYRGAVDDAGFTLLFDAADNLRFETDDYVGDVLVTASGGTTTIALTATLPDA
jgi:hypothetical protein